MKTPNENLEFKSSSGLNLSSWFFTFVLLLQGCSNLDFKKPYQLGEFRFLGIHADTPEVDGTLSSPVTVTLTPYISDIDFGGRTFIVSYTGCPSNEFDSSDLSECFLNNPPITDSLNTNALTEAPFTGSLGPSSLGSGAAITVTIADPSALLAGKSASVQHNGVNFIFVMSLTSGSDSFLATQIIKVSNKSIKNTNPTGLTNLNFSSLPTQDYLNFKMQASGAESYQEMATDGSLSTQTETLFVSHYTDIGVVFPYKTDIANTSRFNLSTSPPQVFISVVRDLRGGLEVLFY